MHALYYTAPQRIEYASADEPQAGPGEAVVEVQASGICGSDMHAYHGHDPRRVPPLILGHEAAGRCLSGRYAGQLVTMNPLIPCGVCAPCREDRPNLCADKAMIGMNRPGAMANRVAIPETQLVPLPQGLSAEHGALAEPAATALHGIRLADQQTPRPLAEHDALIIGAGAIGILAALILRWQGVAEPAITELNHRRRETAYRAGFARTLDPTQQRPADATYPLVIDAVGAPATRDSAMRAVSRGGTILSLGLQENGGELNARRLTLEEIALLGAYTYTPADFRAAVEALGAGRLGTLEWVEQRPLAQGARAFEDLDTGNTGAGKIVLMP